MKKVKKIILCFIALLPLLILFVPVVVSFGAENRATMPKMEVVTIENASTGEGTIHERLKYTVTIFDDRYTNSPDTAAAGNLEGFQPGMFYRFMESFMDLSYGEIENGYAEYTIKPEKTVEFATVKALYTIYDSISPVDDQGGQPETNYAYPIMAIAYGFYLFTIWCIDTVLTVITYVPRKITEWIER